MAALSQHMNQREPPLYPATGNALNLPFQAKKARPNPADQSARELIYNFAEVQPYYGEYTARLRDG
jgi:hypothetical protein